MRIKFLLISFFYGMILQAQPVLINLTNGTTGQFLAKSSNTSCDYTWVTVNFNTLAPTKTGNALKYLRVNAGETDYELVTLAGGGDLLAANNLSDLANAGTARTNLSLGNVNNTSDANKPVSTATQTALDLKANIASPTFTGTVSGVTSTMVGLGNVTNESKATMFTSPTFTGTPVVPGYMPNTATVGVANCPTATGTQTITHGLGRTPVIIEIYGVGRFTSNAAATPTPFSSGTWTSVSGNSCVYMTTAGTTTQDGLSSTTFSVFIATSSGNTMSGIIQNVGATTFDIAWTEVGTAAALPLRWKAQ